MAVSAIGSKHNSRLPARIASGVPNRIVADPSSPRILGEYKNLGAANEASYSFHLVGARLYTFQYFAGGSNGRVFDVKNGLGAAKEIQRLGGYYSWHSVREGKLIYVSRLNGLEVFEVLDPN